jgi:hypothetical protein
MNDDTTMDPVPVEVTDLTRSEDALVGQMQTILTFFLDLLQVTGGYLDTVSVMNMLLVNMLCLV